MGAGPSGLFISEASLATVIRLCLDLLFALFAVSFARVLIVSVFVSPVQVCVFEKTNRYGGRVFDYWFPQMPDSEPVGLGAWRIDQNHTDVW